MKKIKHRLPAFTIMELTVAMLISAIVIAITYTAFSMVSGSYVSYTAKHNEMAVLIRLDELLKKDFIKADDIYQEQDGVRFLLKQQPISYRFEPGEVIRISTVTDTFKVATDALILSFERQPLSSETSTDQELNRVDELAFSIVYQKEKFPYHYLKQYSSKNLINRNPNAIH
jgi:Tfp pilus assembly protein PilE